MDTVSCVVVGRMRRAVLIKLRTGIIKRLAESSPTCTDVDAPDDEEDDEGAIAVVDETSTLHKSHNNSCNTPT
jgi:hypothetical protein